uniref:Uncharacterized protein n=1 Tax=viral metagenome TaxID=1070528 RepID=A0A6M3JX88_9ZZZZ
MSEISEAKRLINADNAKEDLIAAGFKRLDPELITDRPPKIQWGILYKAFNPTEKIEYLEKLASSMNHAAYLIQEERNSLLKLCDMKDKQVNAMKVSMQQNMDMLQSEVTKMNEDKRESNKAVADLNRQIRELKNGSNKC